MTATRTRSAGRLSGSAAADTGCSLGRPSIVLSGSRIGSVLVRGSATGVLSMLIESPRFAGEVPQDRRGIARDDRVWRRIASHDAAGPDDRVFADDHVREDCGARSDRGAPPHRRGLHLPVLLRLKLAG